MISVGIDMVELERIERAMSRKAFLSKILGDKEYEQMENRKFPVQSIAANFCAKEAFSKAIGTGFRGFKMSDIQIMRDEQGKPFIKLSESLKELILADETSFAVSVTHTKNYASAVVIYCKG